MEMKLISGASMLLAEADEGWLFGLDAQLVSDTILLAIAVFVLFTVMSYALFNPARDMLEKRRQKIRTDIDDAEKAKADALALKEEYNAKLRDVNKEAEDILSEARKRAKKSEAKIIEEAKEEAARIMERANQEVELEKKHAVDDMKKEMIQIASLMAGKVVAASIDTTIQNQLVDDTLKEMGDSTWLS